MPSVSLPLPLIGLAAAAILAGLLLYLVISLKIDVWQLKKKCRAQDEALRDRCKTLEERLAGMEATVQEAEARAAVLVPPPSSRSGMNMNKRVQAARMSKRGERPEQIAAALGLPPNEVALLLKVQRLTLPN
jgi:hypothetical protein